MFWHHLQIFLLSSLLEIFCDGKHHKILLHGYVNCSCSVRIHQFFHFHFHNHNLRSVFPKNLTESPESDCESWVKPKTIISLRSSDNQCESPISPIFFSTNLCLFTFWGVLQGKRFQLKSKNTKKCLYNLLYLTFKNICQPLRLVKLKFMFCKIGCSISWTT